MISRFFIDRPIFANVLAIITVLFGVVSAFRLPVERYLHRSRHQRWWSVPLTPARTRRSSRRPSPRPSSSNNGVENMMYMSSTSSADGSYSLTITFEIGTNLDDAQVQVQNRLSIAEPQLPEEVRRQGVTVRKQSASIVLAIF